MRMPDEFRLFLFSILEDNLEETRTGFRARRGNRSNDGSGHDLITVSTVDELLYIILTLYKSPQHGLIDRL